MMKTKVPTIVFIVAFAIWNPGCEQSALTNQQIIDIANRAATSRGLDLDKYWVYYDEDNIQSKSKLAHIKGGGPGFANMFKTLKGQDLQAVLYKRKGTRGPKGTYTFFIDRKAGKVIAVFKEK